MNARLEAYKRLGGRYETRVLAPSPPAVAQSPWFADDPVARGDVPEGQTVVSPVSTGDVAWDQLAGDDPALAAWCAERWLGAHPRLDPVPADLIGTRRALQELAERVISPARQQANGKIGLRYTNGGFGTPFFGPDTQVRVCGTELVVDEAAGERAAPITTLRAAARHLGPALLAPDPDLADDPLAVDAQAAAFLGDWYGFATWVLEELRAGAGPDLGPSRVQLWPEHFDLAVEIGAESAGARAGYGFSPGDEQHPEPYVYVVPRAPPSPGELWQAIGFAGAELPYADLLHEPDQQAVALAFLRARLGALTG
jgi:hypothetical protein